MTPEPTLTNTLILALVALLYTIAQGYLQKRTTNDIKKHAERLVEEPIRQVRKESAERDEAAAITVRQFQEALGVFTLSTKVNMESHQAVIADLRNVNIEQRRALADRDHQVATLQNDYSNLQTQYRLVMGRLETSDGALGELLAWKESQLLASGRRDEEISKLQEDGKKISSQLQAEHDAAERTRSELERTQGDLEAAKTALEKAEVRIRELEKQHAAEMKTAQNEKQALIQERDSLKEKVEALQREVATLRSQVQQLQSQQAIAPEPTKDLPLDAAKKEI